MDPQPPLSQPASDDAPQGGADFAREVLEEQLAGLRRLAQIGLAICEDIGERSAESAGRSPGADHVELRAMKAAAVDLPFARTSRAVRLTYAMQRETLEQLRRVGHIEEANAASAARARAEHAADRERTVRSVLTRIIHDEAFGPEGDTASAPAAQDDDGGDRDRDRDDEGEDASDRSDERETCERLIAEAREVLEDRERFGDLSARPASDVIALICRELGVEPDWLKLSDEAWAREEVCSGIVGKALASFSSPACGGGGPAQPVEGARPTHNILARNKRPTHSAPSTASRSPSPAGGGEETSASP